MSGGAEKGERTEEKAAVREKKDLKVGGVL